MSTSPLLSGAIPPRAPDSAATAESGARRTLWASLLGWLVVGLKIGSQLLLIPLSLHFLGAREYAFYIVIYSLYGSIGLSEMGINQTMANWQAAAFARQDRAAFNRILATGCGLYWIIGAAIGVLWTLVIATQPVDLWLLRDGAGHWVVLFKWSLAIAGLLALLRMSTNAFDATLRGIRETAQRQGLVAAMTVLVLLVSVLALALRTGLLGLIIASNLCYIACEIGLYFLARRTQPWVRLALRGFSPRLAWPLLANSFFFFLMSIGVLFQRVAGNLLAARFGPLSEVPAMYLVLTLLRVAGWTLADV